MDQYIFIHVGKSAGATVNRLLSKFFDYVDIPYKQVHFEPVEHEPNAKYILWLRNPLTRFVSAFNWIDTPNDYVNSLTSYVEGSRFTELSSKFKSANDLAEQLYTNPEAMELITWSNYDICERSLWNYCRNHIVKDLCYYLDNGKFIEEHYKDIIYVGTQENMDNDLLELKELLNIPDNMKIKSYHVNKNNKNTHLSDLAKKNLQQFLKKEYDCIQLIIDKGLIEPNKIKSYFYN
jgi:hypothetical protein